MSSNSQAVELKGLATSRGVVCGPVYVHREADAAVVLDRVVPPGGEDAELEMFHRGLAAARQELEELAESLRARAVRGEVTVFESLLMMLDDPVLIDETERRIRTDRVCAQSAVRSIADRYRARFAQMKDPYIRERVRDLEDVESRLLKHMVGEGQSAPIEIGEPSVFVANDLSPFEAMRLPPGRVIAIVLEGGSPTSHVALLARAMGIPAVTGVPSVTTVVRPGDRMLVNGVNGSVVVNPDGKSESAFRRGSLRNSTAAASEEPGMLADGSSVLIFANMHPGLPTDGILRSGATGVGLYRSEYLWLNAGREPTEDEQFAAYRSAAQFATGLSPKGTITLRVLDIGGDKTVRGLTAAEANPYLGNRSIRYLLSHPDTFRTQLRAILRASAHGRICLLYPMVSCVEELAAAAKILASCRAELDAEHVAYDRMMPVGAMIEIPAAALNAAALARYVDFFSIGTNDLIQYTMAADRGNESVASLYQPTHPAVLELMRRTFAAAKANDIPLSVCGESAGDPVLGALWAAMGVDMLSVSAGYVRPLARVLRRLTRADLDAYASLAASIDPTQSGRAIYAQFESWLRARIPDWDKLLA